MHQATQHGSTGKWLIAGAAALLLLFPAALGQAGGGSRYKGAERGKGSVNAPALNQGKGKAGGKSHFHRTVKVGGGRGSKSGTGLVSPNAVRAAAQDELVFGDPIQYHNLSIVPVGTTRKGPFQKYTLLEEGTTSNTLDVRELNGRSGDAQVPAVQVRNRGSEPVYLLGGEMILGGKQDRIISRDTVVAPDKKWTRVAVFCVEAHRWQGQNMRFRAGGALAHVSLRKAAMSGRQTEVWAEVARKNLKHGTQSSSGTYRRTIQNARVRARIANYRQALSQRLPRDIQLAGVVFGINGDIRVADLFGNPVLFDSLEDKLLSAYILEALGHQVVRNARPVSKKAAEKFLHRAGRAKRFKQKASGRSLNYGKEDDMMIGSETVDKATGKSVRKTYIAK